MKRLSDSEAELKKTVAYKRKACSKFPGYITVELDIVGSEIFRILLKHVSDHLSVFF